MNDYGIKEVDKIQNNIYVITADNGNVSSVSYQPNHPILEWIDTNKDSGLFEYKESYRNYNKMKEFKEFLSQNNPDTCQIRLFENGVITHSVIKNTTVVQNYLLEKSSNGDFFKYDLDNNKTILGIPKAEALRMYSQIIEYQKDVKSYITRYTKAIEEATNQVELDAIVFQSNITIAGSPFILGEIILDFTLGEGMSIVDTF